MCYKSLIIFIVAKIWCSFYLEPVLTVIKLLLIYSELLILRSCVDSNSSGIMGAVMRGNIA